MLLRQLSSLSTLPWVCVGDFNEVLDEGEKLGGRDKPRSQLESFRSTIDDCGLQDLGFFGPKFT